MITGFVNALAILIFMAQLPELTHVSWVVYAMTAAGLAIIYGFAYLTKAVPSLLVTIVVLTAVSLALGLDIRTGSITAVSALDKVVLKFKREGAEVEVVGLNEASATMVDRFAVHDKPGAVEQLMH